MGPFVLVDCNNFYVSCERVFNPKLDGRPVIILSNNDGCVVARSKEAKALGIKMAVPFFTIKELCQREGVIVQSSNYRLYGDLSSRIMEILSSHAPECEVYSIDEAFLRYPSSLLSQELFHACCQLREKIKRWVGIPVSLGIGRTRTQAKLANEKAKGADCLCGVFDLSSAADYEEILNEFSTEDVWGIGSRWSKKLTQYGINTALQFARKDPSTIRSIMGVAGERTYWELQGKPCISLDDLGYRKSIMSSRSFGRTVVDLSELEEALSTYVFQACVKMRRQGSYAQAIQVYLKATDITESGKFKFFYATHPFAYPVHETTTIITAAKAILRKIYSSDERYKKCGVILLDLIPEERVPRDLFSSLDSNKDKTLSKAIDQINQKFGKGTLFYAAMGTQQSWKMRSETRSPCYTTNWEELAQARAD